MYNDLSNTGYSLVANPDQELWLRNQLSETNDYSNFYKFTDRPLEAVEKCMEEMINWGDESGSFSIEEISNSDLEFGYIINWRCKSHKDGIEFMIQRKLNGDSISVSIRNPIEGSGKALKDLLVYWNVCS
jgi:hypothetical protein